MRIHFDEYRGQTTNQLEKKFLIDFIKQVKHSNSYSSQLQMLYNNKEHFNTIDISLCKYSQLREIVKEDTDIYIQGNIHENYHTSNILVDRATLQPLFVKDSYIRFRDSFGTIRHILVYPPEINTMNYLVKHPYNCDRFIYLITPTIINK